MDSKEGTRETCSRSSCKHLCPLGIGTDIEGTAFILLALNTDMMPTLWHSVTGMRAKA